MYPLDISIYFSLLLDRKNTEVLNRYLPKKNPTQKRDTTKPANSLLPSENSRPAQQKKHKGPTVASAVMSLPAMTFFARSVGCKWNGYFAGNYGHLRKYHHRGKWCCPWDGTLNNQSHIHHDTMIVLWVVWFHQSFQWGIDSACSPFTIRWMLLITSD